MSSPDRIHLPWRRRLKVAARTAWAFVRRPKPKLWRSVGAVLLVASSLLAGYQAGPGACRSRAAGRSDVRRAIVAGVDEVGDFAELDPSSRDVVVSRVEGRVGDELPPPDCWSWPAVPR